LAPQISRMLQPSKKTIKDRRLSLSQLNNLAARSNLRLIENTWHLPSRVLSPGFTTKDC
jgi:hypothetical protein